MTNRLSITQKVRKYYGRDRLRNTTREWAEKFEDECNMLIRNMEESIRKNDYDLQCRTTGQLKEVLAKHNTALQNVLTALCDKLPERSGHQEGAGFDKAKM